MKEKIYYYSVLVKLRGHKFYVNLRFKGFLHRDVDEENQRNEERVLNCIKIAFDTEDNCVIWKAQITKKEYRDGLIKIEY